ncbi:MAG: hypothetical protein IT236_13360, partial [Bacteroidia bacterium]|nr:hypothetical protein [Bacteroidia bacterium]
TADMLSILPYNIIGFKAYGFSSFASLAQKSERFAKKTNGKFWSSANEVAMFNLRKEFNENIKNHLVAFETAVSSHEFVAAEITDTVKSINHLRFMSDTVFSLNGYSIYQMKVENESLNIFEPLLNSVTRYCALKNSFVIFAASSEELALLLDNIDHGQLALNNESFNYYRGQHFPDSYNYLVYTSPSANKKMISSFFNFSAVGKKDPFENLKHFSYSLVNDANAFKFRLQLLNEAESNARQENVLWTLLLDTLSDMKPAAFVNHLTSENEIVVQDAANTLYLVSAKGTVLWKKNLEEKILSEIYRVDVFGNHKFQFLFNTKNHIHLLDRNGKYVKGYPINLPAEATSHMSLIQYINDKDKTNPDEKDLRLFIACADKAIYNYNIHGEAPEGFIPVKTEHEVNLPVQYIKVGKSDYLVALDKEGKIYTFSRKGEGRIGLKNRTLANCSSFYVDAANSIANTHLICVDDKSGLINKIKFTDEKELIKVNMDHGSADIQFSLIDDNRDMDIVITRNSSIQAFNFHGDLLFEKNLGTELSNTTYYSDESHSFYYSINSAHSELLVFDVMKQKVKKIKAGAMPLVISLFNDNKKYLVVTNGSQLSCLPLD